MSTTYHEDARCGSCNGPLEAHNDALCDTCRYGKSPQTTLHPIIPECVGPAGFTLNIDKPFPRDGYVYATNGHICVRQRGAKCDPPDGETPPVEGLDWTREHYAEAPLVIDPALLPEPPPDVACRQCSGTGKQVRCKECDGSGIVICDYDYDHDCPECKGKGVFAAKADDPKAESCNSCYGTVKADPDYRPCLWPGVAAVSKRYVRLLIRHGGKLYPRVDGRLTHPLYLTVGDDVDGLVMPLKPQKPLKPRSRHLAGEEWIDPIVMAKEQP